MSRPQSRIRYGNRLVQQKQETQTLQKHYQSLKKARPMTGTTIDRNAVIINNKKRQMVQENKYTEIERENRLLFHKISTIMNKGTISQSVGIRDRSAMNKTLNGVYRKKEMQKIEYENARMLKRLKEKKSSYGVVGLQRDWEKKKKVIQNMSLYPYIINDNIGADFKRQKLNEEFLTRHHSTFEPRINLSTRQIRRIRKIDGCMFLITIKFEGNKMFIIGDIKEEQNIKVIELQRKEAESFLIDQCDGNVENLFGLLRFDRASGDLYLVGKDVGEIEKVKEFELQRRRTMSHHDNRGRLSFQQKAQYPPRPMSKQLGRKNNYTLNANNEEEQIDLGINQTKNEKIRINSNLNLLEEQMNEEIMRKVKAKQDSERKQVSEKKVQKQQNQHETQNDKKKDSLWVKVEKKQEQNQLELQSHEYQGEGEFQNDNQVQKDINYQQEVNQEIN